jgi:Fe-S oxidoreductase
VAEGYLAQMFGDDFVPLPENETCCGFEAASASSPGDFRRLMTDKLSNIAATGASQVVST